MKLTIEINCDNAAFAENPTYEVARILVEWADKVSNYGLIQPDNLLDLDGNRVGSVDIIN